MAKKCRFIANEDCISFKTQSNGDEIRIRRVHIDADNAADLAWMIQSCKQVEVIIKEIE